MNDIKKNIKRFFRGEESGEGRRFIDLWYHFFDDKPEKLQRFSAAEKEELRKSLYEDIRFKGKISGNHLHRIGSGSRPANRTWPYKMAAGFAVVLLAVIPVFLFVPEGKPTAPVEFITSSNPSGQASRITLSDGSAIWLSANSSLHYPERFDGTYREVILHGEAFFEVSRHSEKPFIVESAGLETRVLGTSFNIRAFEDEQDIEITVVTGRVSVGQAGYYANGGAMTNEGSPLVLLDPDQQLVYNHMTRQGSTQTVDARLYTSWKDGQLTFEDHTFEEITRRLERWYGVHIHFVNQEIKQDRFRITFENSSLQHALRMLQAIRDFEFEIEERQIWIK